jgi:hypothetical protein
MNPLGVKSIDAIDRSGPSARGISSQVSPSSTRPARLFITPPHCLKKNGTPARRHSSRTSRTHAGSITRAARPLSPPTMTQSMPSSASPVIGPEQGFDAQEADRSRHATQVSARSVQRLRGELHRGSDGVERTGGVVDVHLSVR